VLYKLLLLLAERDRLGLVPDLVAAFRDRLLDYRHVVRAAVTTAVPLAADKAQRVQRSLAQVTGRTVTLETRVDPGIVGRMVAKVGSTVYDASVVRRLQRMRERIESA